MVLKSEQQQLCEEINSMNNSEHIEILRIIRSSTNNISISENSNGCFINMDDIDSDTFQNIKRYVDFYKKKEEELKQQETEKNNLIDSL